MAHVTTELEPEVEVESYAQVICRLHTKPPVLLLTHFAHEGPHCVHPAASSSVEDFSHGASALARPVDWYQIWSADAGQAVSSEPGDKLESIGSNARVITVARRIRRGVRVFMRGYYWVNSRWARLGITVFSHYSEKQPRPPGRGLPHGESWNGLAARYVLMKFQINSSGSQTVVFAHLHIGVVRAPALSRRAYLDREMERPYPRSPRPGC